MNNSYADFKILQHIDRIQSLKRTGSCNPVTLKMILSDLCNHNCSFCTFRLGDSLNKNFGEYDPARGIMNYNPKRFLSKEKALEVIDDCVEMGVRAIEFTGGGEPTVHPNHIEIFKKVVDSGLELALISNGNVMRKGFVETILRASWCRFSIDASTPETYSKIREVSKNTFHKVLKNIEGLVEARQQNKDSNLVIGTSFIVTEDNFNELYDAVKIISELGVDNIRVAYYWTDKGFVTDQYKSVCKQIRKAKRDFESDNFKIIDRFTLESRGDTPNTPQRPDYDYCGYQHVSTWISPDYNLYRCCVTAYDDSGLIGSIRNTSFKQLWESEIKKEKMKNFSAKSCSHCIYNGKNKVMNFILDEDNKHINFM